MANIRDIYFPTIPNMFPEELVANGFKEQTALGVAVYKARESNAIYGVEAGKFYWVNTNGEHIPFFSEAEVTILDTSGAPTNTPEEGDAYITVDADGVLYIWDSNTETWVASGGNANIYTANGTLLADRTVTGGGNDLTFTDIPLFNIDATIARLGQVPTTDDTNTQILTRNSTTGNIEIRSAASLISGTDTNFALNNLTFDANRTHTLGTFDLTLNGTSTSGSSFNVNIDNINLNDNVRTKVRTLLNLQTVPSTNTTATHVLVRDSGTGNVEQFAMTGLTSFSITDGTTTSLINGGETISINESTSTGPIKISLTGNNYTLELDTTGASTGDVLTLDSGNLVFQTPATASNIYNSDGTLTSNRTLNGDNKTLTFNTLTEFNVAADEIIYEGIIKLVTPNVGSSTASTGQFLQLVDDATGEVEWADVSAFGTVTDFTSGNLSPIFTTSVATSTSTPALTFSLSNAAAYTVLGNNTSSSAVPTYFNPVLASALFGNQGTLNTVLHGNASGNPSWGKVDLTADIVNDLPVTHLDGGLNASSTTFWRGDGTWQTIATGGSVTSVAATAPAAGITITGSPITTSGTFVFALANDLAAVEGLSGTGIARRTAIDTWSVGTLVAIAEGGTGLNSLGTAGQVLAVNAGATGLEYITVSGSGYTDEQAQDAVNAMLIDTNTINFTYTDATPELKFDVITQMSVTSDASGVKLVNDETSPTNQKYYGTDISSAKGFFNNFLQYDSSESVWSPYLVTHASKNIGGGFAENILIGKNAGTGLTTGHRNTIVGSGSNGFVLDDAEYISILGYGNMLDNANGYGTTIIGCLNDGSTSGTFNTILGYGNLNSIVALNNGSAASNTIVGYGNATELTGNANIVIGYENLTTAGNSDNNIIIGTTNGQSITTGRRNVIIGYGGGASITTGLNNILIGVVNASVDSTTSNAIVIGQGTASVTNDIIIATRGCENVYLGATANFVSTTLTFHGPIDNTGTDTATADWIFKGGTGTGNATPAKIAFQIAQAGVSGTTVQTHADVLTLKTKHLNVDQGLGLKVETSSAASLTLDNKSVYVFTGSSATTWTLPTVSGNTDRTYLIKNRGTAIITLTRAGSDNIYVTGTVTTYDIHPGDAYQVINDGTYWLIF